MGLFDAIFTKALSTAVKVANQKSVQNSIDAMTEHQIERNIQREIMLAQADKRNFGPSPYEQRVIEQILCDYPDFDISYAKSCIQTVAEMMADAYKKRPKDFSSFAKLCNEKTVMKIERFINLQSIFWFERNVVNVEFTRYNPQEAMPTVMLKFRLMFEPSETYKPLVFFVCYSCHDNAITCPHCGGVVEDKSVHTCPYCDCAITGSATEKAWKITDVRKA